MRKGLEKRSFQRLEFPIDVSVEIRPVEDASRDLPPLSMKSRNISEAGICLETKVIEVEGINLIAGSPAARENRLQMHIKLLEDEQPCIAWGEVRWYDLIRESSECFYQLGVEFLDIDGEGREQLARFLKRNQKRGWALFQRIFG